MHIFYTPDIDSDIYILSEEESKHCVKVLRLQKGSSIQLVDGTGGFYEAILEDPHPKRAVLKVTKVERGYGKRNHYLHIAVAPTKNIERFEWFLEKATEIGIDEITPLICERSERRELKTERLNKVITSAVKQSIKAYHPKLNEAIRLRDFLCSASGKHKYIAHCIESEKFTLKGNIELNSEYLVVIGPEGDFTPAEVREALDADFLPLTLGNSRLRTETAALEACFEINFLNR
ncbi:MAG: 16S rRNA (uracil(1498)-N(3))-methyltransferase [Daejeonella sp.]|uniref:16S rRNA (uracil(1498)-N(3))-methyltransferase n=1 Tax=Daejeonella sp. JGW-45 TaxID=3034148 RepID=UPI0023EB4DA6|nr:16S rRNA (uracil(1498)-N(3))-methyltransferase [Daejeonella sp. JGW-45]